MVVLGAAVAAAALEIGFDFPILGNQSNILIRLEPILLDPLGDPGGEALANVQKSI